jgi:Ca2+-binding RTX toxin-like protein
MATLKLTQNHDKRNGTAQADSINGLAGNDTLAGLAGNDTLNGGIGNDSLEGGTDDDRLIGDEGNDTLVGGGRNDWLVGGADSDKLDGGAGADTLDGGTGADALTGGDGDDYYVVDNLGDRISEADRANGGQDTVASSIDVTLPANVENLILTGLAGLKAIGNTLANWIRGNAADNWLDGGNGFDTLEGGDGDDTLTGGAGADSLIGGDGSDSYRIDSPEDKISETARGGDRDEVESSVSHVLGDYLEILTLKGPEPLDGTGNGQANSLNGNDADNTLTGRAGADTLIGNGGADTLQGGSGNDEMDGGEGEDRVIYTGSKADYAIVLEDGSQTWIVTDGNPADGDDGSDRLTRIETLGFADGDYEPGNPVLTVADVRVNEGHLGSRSATVEFRLSGPALTTVSFDYQTIDDTAVAGSDYRAASGSLTLAKGQGSVKLELSLLGDTQLEPDESFRVVLGNVTGARLDVTEANVILLNDDLPSLSIQGTRQPEGDSGRRQAFLTVKLSEPSSQPVSVRYANSPTGTATANADYVPVNGVLSFDPGELSKTIAVELLGDTLLEPDEQFRIQLSSPQNAQLNTTAGSAAVEITNDDRLGVTLASTPATSFRAGQSLSLSFSFNDIPQGFDDSDIQVSGGSLTGLRPDTSGKRWTASFTPTPSQDDLTVRISVPAGSYSNAAGQPGQASPVLELQGDTRAPAVSIEIDTRQLQAGQPARLTFRFSEAPVGFTAADLRTGGGSLGTPVAVGDDATTWIAEYLAPVNVNQTLNLSLPAGSYTDAAGNSGTASNVVQLKVDTRLPTLATAAVSVAEDNGGTGTVSLSVVLSAPSTQTVTINYATVDDTARVGQDYFITRGQLTFVPGQTRQSLQIPLVADALLEADESFWLQLSDPDHALLSDTASTARITLLNDDQPQVSIQAVRQDEGQAGTRSIPITLTLSAAYNQPVSVDYATADGTARAGTDYTSTRGTLTFQPGETRKTFTVPVKGDTLVEPDETLQLGLSQARGATLAPAASTATLTLVNDDYPLPELSISGTRLNEGNNGNYPLSLRVSLSAAALQPISVNYATGNDTALAGSDYTPATGQLVFQPGETEKTVSVTVFGDRALEDSERFRVELSNAVNATLTDANRIAVVTLTNDDAAALPTLSLSGTRVKEGQSGVTSASLTVSLSAAASQPVSVNYSTVNGTALAGSDYQASSGTLSFAPGQTSQTISIPVIGDTTVEPDENFQVQLSNPQNANLSTTRSALIDLLNDDVVQVSSYTKGQAVINLGKNYGKLIHPVQVDGGRWFYFWDVSGDGTSADTQGAGYANSTDYVSHDWLDKIFQQDVNGRVEGETGVPVVYKEGDTDNTYRYATLNGVKLALPTVGNGDDFIDSNDRGFAKGTATSGIARNSTYDDCLAIWDAYNGTETGMGMVSTLPEGWINYYDYWLATPSEWSGHAATNFVSGYVGGVDDVNLSYVALEVLDRHAPAAVLNDDQPTLSISGTRLNEGQSGTTTATATVSLSVASSQPVSVDYGTVDITAQAGSDYTTTSGRLTFQPGQTSQTISILVLGDSTGESDENFRILLSNPTHANLSGGSGYDSAVIKLLNDDTIPVSSYTPGQPVIDLGYQYGKLIHPVQVDGGRWFYYWDISGDGTRDNTRGAAYAMGTDYMNHDGLDSIFQQDVNGRVEGENGAQVVHGDGNTDNTYRFATINGVKLALPTIGNGDDFIGSGEWGFANGTSVTGTARNPTYDDYLAIWDAYNGTGTRMDMDGTPGSWNDYAYWSATPSEWASHSFVNLLTGDVNANFDIYGYYVAVEVLGSNTTGAVLPTLALSGTRVKEGQSGVTSASLTVSLSQASSQPVSVNYSTVNGTALAGSDYQASSGTLSFAPGQTSQTISIPVIGDTTVEPDENFQVQLSNPQNGNLGTTRSALIDLLNDDTIQFGNYTQGQAVIDLGSQYGKLIQPVQVDGGRWFYFWDVSGDGTPYSTRGAGYANRYDDVTHDWLDKIFQQDVNGRVEGENGAPVVQEDGNTDNTYRFATLNGVKLALPTIGDGSDFIGSGEIDDRNGTAVSGTASNPTYDDYLAIWDAYNGTGTGTVMDGVPGGWGDYPIYWSATPSASGHASLTLDSGYVNTSEDFGTHFVAVEVW